MIAASKMRRAQEMALQSRPYAEDMRSLLADLAAQPAPDDEEYIHPLLRRREIKRAEIVVITPDRGLTGGLHSRINRVVGEFILERQKEGVETSVVAVGRKGREFLVRTGQDVRAVFSDLGDRPELEDVRPNRNPRERRIQRRTGGRRVPGVRGLREHGHAEAGRPAPASRRPR